RCKYEETSVAVTSFTNQTFANRSRERFIWRNSMKRVLIVVALIIVAAVFGLWRSHGGVRAGLSRMVNGTGAADSQSASVDEIRKTFELKPGEKVWIQGINGSVEIQTS